MVFSWLDIFFLRKEAKKLFQLLNIRPGMSVAEIGGGNGAFSVLLAKEVGSLGFVFTTEFERKKLNKIIRKAEKSDLANLQTGLASAENPNLPERQFDIIFMRKVYHHFTHSDSQNLEFYKHLKLGGKLAIVDFEPKWYLKLSQPKGIPKQYGGHGIFKNVLIEEVEKTGFKLKKLMEDFEGREYCAIFEKH